MTRNSAVRGSVRFAATVGLMIFGHKYASVDDAANVTTTATDAVAMAMGLGGFVIEETAKGLLGVVTPALLRSFFQEAAATARDRARASNGEDVVMRGLSDAQRAATKRLLIQHRLEARRAPQEFDVAKIERFTKAALAWLRGLDASATARAPLHDIWRDDDSLLLGIVRKADSEEALKSTCAEAIVPEAYQILEAGVAGYGVSAPETFRPWFFGEPGYGIGWWNETHQKFRRALAHDQDLLKDWAIDSLNGVLSGIDELRHSVAHSQELLEQTQAAILNMEPMLAHLVRRSLIQDGIDALAVDLALQDRFRAPILGAATHLPPMMPVHGAFVTLVQVREVLLGMMVHAEAAPTEGSRISLEEAQFEAIFDALRSRAMAELPAPRAKEPTMQDIFRLESRDDGWVSEIFDRDIRGG